MPLVVLGLVVLYALSGASGHPSAREQFIMRRPAPATATLWVDAATGSDSNTIAQVRAGNGSVKWASIGRAVWGSTDRSSPNASEAAAAGDTVAITGGTYDYSGTVDNNAIPVYDAANAGTAGNYITFSCVGDCTLTAADALSPVVGGTKGYVKWYADISQGYSWIISACGEEPSNDPTDDCPSGTVAAKRDRGVVTLGAQSVWIEGFVITGHAPIVYPDTENWPAIRLQDCDDCVIRNNTISGFDMENFPGNSHAVCFNLYNTRDSIIEHNRCYDSNGGISLKDNVSMTQGGNIFRYNLIENVTSCLIFSHQVAGGSTETGSFFYQNVCDGFTSSAVNISGATDDWVFNNTFYNGSGTAFDLTTVNTSGVRIWNNILHTAAGAIIVADGAATMVADTVTDLEHNVYHAITTFYQGSDGNRTFASFVGAYADQEQATPGSVSSNPLLVSVATGDFRLCTSAGVPDAGCSGASPAINLGVDLYDLDGDGSTSDTINAGAYLTNAETIGLEQ